MDVTALFDTVRQRRTVKVGIEQELLVRDTPHGRDRRPRPAAPGTAPTTRTPSTSPSSPAASWS